MFGLFGKKVTCFQCNSKVKHKDSSFRRGFRFCGDGCVEAFLAENRLAPRGGDESSWREEAKQHLGLALGEIVGIFKVAGGNASVFSAANQIQVLSAVSAIGNKDEVTDAFGRYNSHVLNALPFLYGLGLDADCAALETQDLDELYELSAMGAGPMQMRKVLKLVEPVVPIVQRAYESL